METKHIFSHLKPTISIISILLFFISANVRPQVPEETIAFRQFSGKVVDANTGEALVFATLSIEGTNISTITNADGEFLLKVPETNLSDKITVSFIGYDRKIILISQLEESRNQIKLDPSVTHLPEINIAMPKDAKSLVVAALSKKGENYLNQDAIMTAFYRETIKKRNKNVSLAEAIVNIYKEPYTSGKKDNIELYKSRKNTDYSKLDTVALKLQGGPFNPLYVDLIKYPEYVFADDEINQYIFSFSPSTTINGRPVFVVNFKQSPNIEQPLYYGKLFIDSQTWALVSAIYNLNVENKTLAANLFVKKKPKDVFVYPTNAAYRIDYREKNGKWYYGYSNVQLTFKINRKKKWFNSVYSLSSEMAITDWRFNTQGEVLKGKNRLRPSIIISDEISGFSDPEFWGPYNVIEPEKSIESAINKIKRQLKRTENSSQP
ncbi:MAG: carboxypeptidase-like regulatory domain-containing protein [Flavobacteriaceae bacterium]|nr:carboxypeptidase-like regulatory domain-containing protein [Flavobacteriaceae bacterium]